MSPVPNPRAPGTVLLPLIALGALLLWGCSRQEPASTGASDPAVLAVGGRLGMDPPPPNHFEFTRLLSEVARPPLVDYARLAERRSELDRYIGSLGATSPAELERLPGEAQLAFWINAYNACMLRIVVDHYPIRRGGFGIRGTVRALVARYPTNSVWQIRDVFWRAHCPVAGAFRSQDEIEHEIIRPRFQEPRIHFAVNCAARSCPVLWTEAYEGPELEAQLDRAVVALMENAEHFRIELGPPATLHLNKVLDWYQDDFGGTLGIREFFAGYLEGAEAEALRRADTQLRFFEYDWTLNDLPR